MKSMKKTNKNSNLFPFYAGLVAFLFLFATSLYFLEEKSVAAQEGASLRGDSPFTKLLTEPYFNIKSNAGIEGTLSARGAVRAPVFDIASQGFRGRVYTAGLTEERRYFFPDLSGEICLTAGNCEFAPTGIPNRLAKFTEEGLTASSVTDLDTTTGVGIANPAYRLHVGGRIQAEGDICTDLGGGFCLSSVGEGQESFSESIVDGEGSLSYIPLWRNDRNLGDSIIRQSEGNIGIGTSPVNKLDVAGTVRMLGFRLPVNPTDGYGLMTDDRGFGTWKPVLTPEGTRADVAERFEINPLCKEKGNCPKPGDVVSITNKGFIEKSTVPYDSKLVGIISTDPELTLNTALDLKLSRPVALIGRVPTKVSLENGDVSAGDFLTSSSIPGVAMKAVASGRVVGIALESLSSRETSSGIGEINVLINLHYNEKNSSEESLKITDKETGKKYCLEIRGGEMVKSLCE